MYVDTDLVTLAYFYLAKIQRKTHKKYTIADLFEVCEVILQKSEKKNQFQKRQGFKFTDGHFEITSKELEKRILGF